jgi:hypothetical protein
MEITSGGTHTKKVEYDWARLPRIGGSVSGKGMRFLSIAYR